MVIHIKLSDRKTADTDDPLGRSWYGYDPEATPAELWENNRGDWRLLAERIAAERWAALNYQGRVVLVAELEDPAYKILPGTTPPKKALFGRVLPEGHPVREALMRTQVVYSSRNAIQYDPAVDVAGAMEADSSALPEPTLTPKIVSTRVNSVRNNGPELIEPAASAAE